jgi:hypothetical protein
MEKRLKFKVYCLIDPETNEIKYIGITSRSLNKRLKEHIQKSKFKQTHKDCWIKKLLDKNHIPKIEFLDEVDDYKFWEPYYISLYKSWGFKLVNSTNGGDYNELSIESKLKISAKLKGNTHGFKTGGIPFVKGKKFTIDSEFFKSKPGVKNGSKITEEHKNKIGKALINKRGIAVLQCDKDGKIIKEWPSAQEVQRSIGISNNKINMVCRGYRNTAGGFIWKYK